MDEGCSKYVIPGDRLFPISEELKAGIGTYELFGHIYASLAGTLHIYTAVEVSFSISCLHRNDLFDIHTFSSILQPGIFSRLDGRNCHYL